MGGFYKASVIRELLPVVDNFERALKHVPKDLESNDYIKGIQGVVKKFEQTLEKLGLQRIKTVGEHFDPNLHEAVSAEEGDREHEIVSEELQSGWKQVGASRRKVGIANNGFAIDCFHMLVERT
jgi:molecular chaperone GrpE